MIVVLDVSVAREESVYALENSKKTVVSTDGMLVGMFSVFESMGKQAGDIEGIVVVFGQGRFTSTRTATIMANAWALVFDTPVISVSPEEILDQAMIRQRLREAPTRYVAPAYYAPPNITTKKSLL